MAGAVIRLHAALDDGGIERVTEASLTRCNAIMPCDAQERCCSGAQSTLLSWPWLRRRALLPSVQNT